MLGNSFSKRFLNRYLYDAVHLLARAKFNGLPLSANNVQDAARMLADKAKTLAIPLAQAFLASFIAHLVELFQKWGTWSFDYN